MSALYSLFSVPDSLRALGTAEIPARILQRTPGVTSLFCPVFSYSFQSLPIHYLTTTGLHQFNFPKVFETPSVWLGVFWLWCCVLEVFLLIGFAVVVGFVVVLVCFFV